MAQKGDIMQLLATKTFNGVALDCYIEPEQTDKGSFWATSEQIGRLLEYVAPDVSIRKIHQRNKARLDKFSTSTKLVRIEGERTVTREVRLYNFKGLLEICRYSYKPNADAVMDWLWDVADEIRRTGMYTFYSSSSTNNADLIKAANEIISKAFACKSNSDFLALLALDKVFREVYGKSALTLAGLSISEEVSFGPDNDPEDPKFLKRHSHFELHHCLSWERNYGTN